MYEYLLSLANHFSLPKTPNKRTAQTVSILMMDGEW